VTVLPAALHEVEEIAAACRAAGRAPERLYKTGFTLGCVLRDGEDATSPRARAQAGPLVPVMFHAFLERTVDPERLGPELGPAVTAFRAQYESYSPPDARYLQLHKGHLMWVRPGEEPFVTPELIRMATFTAGAPARRSNAPAISLVKRFGAAGRFFRHHVAAASACAVVRIRTLIRACAAFSAAPRPVWAPQTGRSSRHRQARHGEPCALPRRA